MTKSFKATISPEIEAILRDEFETLQQDPNLLPRDFPELLKASQERLKAKVTEYRQKLEKECQERMRSGSHRTRTVTDAIKDRIKFENPGVDPTELSKPVGELFPLMRRFDWRSFNVLPEVRKQASSACWAAVATQVFESNLGIQLANFSTFNGGVFTVSFVGLNQNSTLDNVEPRHDPKGGRYERAFNHYCKDGIPLAEISVDSNPNPTHRDVTRSPQVSNATKAKPVHAKAIGWNYVNAKPWITPTPSNREEFENIKRALLERGPLAVAVAATQEFFDYGPDNNDELAKRRRKSQPKPGVNLRFPAEAPVSFVNINDGIYALELAFSAELLADTRQDRDDNDVIVRFLADKAPKLEMNPEAPFNPLSGGGDDAVENFMTYKFSINNGVVFETDESTGEMILRFPANTSARFAKDRKTGDLIARFPADAAPVFDKNTGFSLNHVVMLIGWDDDKEAWIIQNASGSDWGYQCNGPNVRAWQKGSENRGYMYIRYGCNNIGQFAAWLEAPLLDEAWINKKLAKSQSR